MNCLVNSDGELLEILQIDRKITDGEFKVPLSNYYEILNIERYPKTIWDFKLKTWIGVGKPIIPPTPEPSEFEKLKANVDYLLLINGEV